MAKPKDFSVDELETLMGHCDCEKSTRGKASGSAIAYIHKPTQKALYMHTPHPTKIFKQYQIKEIISFLESIGYTRG